MREYLRRGELVRGVPRDPLTAREHRVVELIAQSLTGKEIADALVGALQVGVGDQAGATVARTGDVDRVQVAHG
jgi:hypothetical protein